MTSKEIARKMKAWLESYTLPGGAKTVATKCSECEAHNYRYYGFCWRCGSPLTDEAVDFLAKRLEDIRRAKENLC